jgi:hypothetical protein
MDIEKNELLSFFLPLLLMEEKRKKNDGRQSQKYESVGGQTTFVDDIAT